MVYSRKRYSRTVSDMGRARFRVNNATTCLDENVAMSWDIEHTSYYDYLTIVSATLKDQVIHQHIKSNHDSSFL
jgi:hypothetical protein